MMGAIWTRQGVLASAHEKAPPEVGPKAGLEGCGAVWQPRKRILARFTWTEAVSCNGLRLVSCQRSPCRARAEGRHRHGICCPSGVVLDLHGGYCNKAHVEIAGN
jgi:hypothetical protein